MTEPRLSDFLSEERLARLFAEAREEDFGPATRDLTSALFLPPGATGEACFRTRAGGVIAGLALLPPLLASWAPGLTLELEHADGRPAAPGTSLARLGGPLAAILGLERTALNCLTHLSGIATLTDRHVRAAGPGGPRISDSRKTLPGLRGLQKYAVACGGGHPHRMGLHDAVLVKDNHLAHLAPGDLAGTLAAGVRRARAVTPPPRWIEIEVDHLDQLPAALAAGPDIVLLDNFDPDELAEAVRARHAQAPGIELEASGGITLERIPAVAASGVDRIAVGALTHSAPALDIGLDIA